MCVPQPQVAAAPASTVPSMQAANNLDLGGSGAPRGAANLGRLQLRLTGNPTGSAPVAAAPAPATQATSTAGQASIPSSASASATGGISGGVAPVGITSPNLGLRLNAR